MLIQPSTNTLRISESIFWVPDMLQLDQSRVPLAPVGFFIYGWAYRPGTQRDERDSPVH
jgi:hypothetical protein